MAKNLKFGLIALFFFLAVPAFAVETDKSVYNYGENGVIQNCVNSDGHWYVYDLNNQPNYPFVDGYNKCVLLPIYFLDTTPLPIAEVSDYSVVEITNAGNCQFKNYSECVNYTRFVNEFLFEIILYVPPEYHILTIGSASSTDLLAGAGTLFTDLWPILLVVIGIPLAFYIIQRVIKLVPATEKQSDTGTAYETSEIYEYDKKGVPVTIAEKAQEIREKGEKAEKKKREKYGL